MLKSSLCEYSDAYMLVKGNVTIPKTVAACGAANKDNEK